MMFEGVIYKQAIWRIFINAHPSLKKINLLIQFGHKSIYLVNFYVLKSLPLATNGAYVCVCVCVCVCGCVK